MIIKPSNGLRNDEEREKIFRHRDSIYESEFARLSGAPTYSLDDIRAELEMLYAATEE